MPCGDYLLILFSSEFNGKEFVHEVNEIIWCLIE